MPTVLEKRLRHQGGFCRNLFVRLKKGFYEVNDDTKEDPVPARQAGG